MLVILSHPWRWHHPRDVLDTARGQLTEAEAANLVRAGYAQTFDQRVRPLGGGWLEVVLADGNLVKVQGRQAAERALRKDAMP